MVAQVRGIPVSAVRGYLDPFSDASGIRQVTYHLHFAHKKTAKDREVFGGF